ncbi:MAG: nitroreductase family protein [Chloroflexi bacterium]|nr:nitroreductase family protein [Chloroflexota bacterium]
MKLKEMVLKTRSYRRFDQGKPIAAETLVQLVDMARQAGSAANRQPLKYIVCAEGEANAKLFAHLRWAGYLQGWGGPAEGERPTGYVVMLTDTEINKEAATDVGIAAQTIMLGATEVGLGGCMLGAINRDEIRKLFAIPERYAISLVLALGVPVEQVVLEPVGPSGDIKYYRDEKQVHHVPKRTLDEVLLTKIG